MLSDDFFLDLNSASSVDNIDIFSKQNSKVEDLTLNSQKSQDYPNFLKTNSVNDPSGNVLEIVDTSSHHVSQNIDSVISSTQNEIKYLLQQAKFDKVINYLDSNFPNFLNQNKELLYLLMKMKFFFLLLEQGDTKTAEDFYFNIFRNLGMSLRSHWERKEHSFLKLIKNPLILKNKDVVNKNIEDFMLNLNRSLYAFLYNINESKLNDDASVYTENSYSGYNNINLNNLAGNLTGNINNIQTNNYSDSPSVDNNQNDNCNAVEELKDLSRYSTKEEFSDYEDEIENYENCLQNNQNEFNQINFSGINHVNSPPKRLLNYNNFLPNFQTNQPIENIIDKSFLNFIEGQNTIKNNNMIKPSNYIPSIDYSYIASNNLHKDKNCTMNIYSKEYVPKKKSECWKNKLPMLKSFKPNYTKRENIDKKILRKFKMYLKDNHKEKTIKRFTDKHFWVMFINGNILPPTKFVDMKTGESVEFKSFNTNYNLWLFSKDGAKELYETFIKEQSHSLVMSISADYQVKEINDMNALASYVNNFAYIFDVGALDGISLDNSSNTSHSKKGSKASANMNMNINANANVTAPKPGSNYENNFNNNLSNEEMKNNLPDIKLNSYGSNLNYINHSKNYSKPDFYEEDYSNFYRERSREFDLFDDVDIFNLDSLNVRKASGSGSDSED